MKIIRLEAENVKRLHAVSITPTGDVVEISGANANGKTSILDAIYWAMAGTAHVQSEPIRRGADKAIIKLDLGELQVTRSFKRKGEHEYTTALKVENAEGASFKSPQTMLDALLSSLTFDPLAFSHMPPREQFDALRAFVPGLDFEKIDNLNRGDFERRTEATRRMNEATAAAGAIAVDEELSNEIVVEDELIQQIADVGTFNAGLENERSRRATAQAEIERGERLVTTKRDEAELLRKKALQIDMEADELQRQIKADAAELAGLPAIEAARNLDALKVQLGKVQALNQRIRENIAARARRESYNRVAKDAAALSDELSTKIRERNKAKHDAIAAAKMPVEGLGFGDGFVTLNGLPFDQASDAEQLKASIAIAMATHSKLRVIRVRDGSLLDDESMALLARMAAEKNVQVWVETVRAVTDSAVIIEDGSVKGAKHEREADA